MTTAAAMQQATRPLTPEQYARRQREFYEAIQPIIRTMTDIMSLQPFRLTLTPGQHVERETLWLPGSKESYDRCVEMIAEYGRLYANTP